MIKDDNNTKVVFEEYSAKRRWNTKNMDNVFLDKLISFLINKKIVKNQNQAYYLFFIFIIIAVIASFMLIRNSVSVESSVIDPSLLN